MTDKRHEPTGFEMIGDGLKNIGPSFSSIMHGWNNLNGAVANIQNGINRAEGEIGQAAARRVAAETMKELPELKLIPQAAAQLDQRHTDFVQTRPSIAFGAGLANPGAPYLLAVLMGGTGANHRPTDVAHKPAPAKPAEVTVAHKPAEVTAAPKPADAAPKPAETTPKPADAATRPTDSVSAVPVATPPQNDGGLPRTNVAPRGQEATPTAAGRHTREIDIARGMGYWKEAHLLLPEGASNRDIQKLARELETLNHNKKLFFGKTMIIPADITS